MDLIFSCVVQMMSARLSCLQYHKRCSTSTTSNENFIEPSAVSPWRNFHREMEESWAAFKLTFGDDMIPDLPLHSVPVREESGVWCHFQILVAERVNSVFGDVKIYRSSGSGPDFFAEKTIPSQLQSSSGPDEIRSQFLPIELKTKDCLSFEFLDTSWETDHCKKLIS